MPSGQQPIRFGLFEVNLETGEIRRDGTKVRLQEQPFQVLAALLEKPGEIVAKEELQERIWKDDTFVDFDRSLATAINKVRQALGDSATRPQYIETVAKRGYRFIGLTAHTEPVGAEGARAGRLAPGEVGVPRRNLIALQLLAVGLGLLLIASVATRPSENTTEKLVRRFSFPVPNIAPRNGGAISPDGKYLLYALETDGGSRLWLRSLANESSRELPGTEGVINGFWSPDSLEIGFGTDRELKRLSLDGGLQTLCELPEQERFPFLGGSWSPDRERIVFSSGLLLYEVPARGGQPALLFEPGDAPRRLFEDPHFLPSDGQAQALAYTALVNPSDRMLTVMNLESGEQRELVPGAWPFYSAGHLIYGPSDRSYAGLQALPFSLDSLTATGAAFPIAEAGWESSVSRDGTLVYRDRVAGTTGILVWRNRAGDLLETVGQPQPRMYMPALSPDGQSIAVSATENTNRDIWVHDLIRSTKDRLSFTPGAEQAPAWSPSGMEIAYDRQDGALRSLVTKTADGTDEPVVLTQAPGLRTPEWSRDGRYLAYSAGNNRSETQQNIYYLDFGADSETPQNVAFLNTAAREFSPKLSPDGRFMAYVSDESGRSEVYVRSFPDGEGRRQLSVEGGAQPSWRSDGGELYYIQDDALMAVAVSTTDRGLAFGLPERLFESADLRSDNAISFTYDVSADGQRFVTISPFTEDNTTSDRIRIVENWYEEFRDREE